MIDDLQVLQADFKRSAEAYRKLAAIPEGSRPNELTPWQKCCIDTGGAYRVAAHEVGKIIKKYTPK